MGLSKYLCRLWGHRWKTTGDSNRPQVSACARCGLGQDRFLAERRGRDDVQHDVDRGSQGGTGQIWGM